MTTFYVAQKTFTPTKIKPFARSLPPKFTNAPILRIERHHAR